MKNYAKRQRQSRVIFVILGVLALVLVIPAIMSHNGTGLVTQVSLASVFFVMARKMTWDSEIAEQNIELSKAQEKLNEELKKYRSREWEVDIAEKERELGLGKWAKD